MQVPRYSPALVTLSAIITCVCVFFLCVYMCVGIHHAGISNLLHLLRVSIT